MVQNEKKRIDNDCQALENRIKLLKMEERKVTKQISATKRQAKAALKKEINRATASGVPSSSIITSRSTTAVVSTKLSRLEPGTATKHPGTASRYAADQPALPPRPALHSQRTLERARAHETRRITAAERQEQLRQDKADKVKVVKTERVRIRAELIEQRKASERKKAASGERVRREKEAAKKKLAASERRRKAALALAWKRRVAGEEKDKRQRENKLKALERLEERCIERLQAKSERQRSIRVGLQQALLKKQAAAPQSQM